MNKIDTKIPLVIAFTPNYFVPASVCILSVLEHAESRDYFHIICLLTEPLSDQMQRKLERLGGDRVQYSFINLEGKLTGIYVDEKYTIAASYRLLLSDLLPEYEKVMYIDCDIVVRNNLAKLFRETNLGDNYLAGVYEATLDFQLSHMDSIGCKPGFYINSGFLIMNLELLRADNMTVKFIAASNSDHLEFPDQDVLNQLCQGRIIGLPPFYNSIRTFFLPQYKSAFLRYYTEADWNAVQEHGTIHYTGSKPWDVFTVKFEHWWRFYKTLPLEIRQEGVVNGKIYQLFKVYDTFMGRWLINTAQVLYRTLKYKQN
ncbi:Lipopolysaccharide biosynthesis protein, LPS:glycosyltransferase [Pedobacter antarcticus]|uniref:Lipopolysaccharide biosynthesis protein, LPS:glycosyltransferase n=1 Tax=Pedobacter antarcticus TaxID=34086 RepID=A0A1I2AM16_9SPHI|nr:glycosyltransferase family 8 protein [Pedobacter antarcticus]SFE44952.1 Lipopolysaccharide biosynthesis protein, LPS:glycosyltransferase [Pedobacter antarcticus]